MQFLKDYLVRLGPDSALVQAALRMHGLRHGYRVEFANDSIILRKDGQEMILSKAQYVQIPIMMECYNLFFETIEGKAIEGRTVLDESQGEAHFCSTQVLDIESQPHECEGVRQQR